MYGWRREYDIDASGRVIGRRDLVDQAQAAIVQEIVSRLLAGDSLGAIARDLTDRQVPTPYAAQTARKRTAGATPYSWIPSSVRKLALRPANIGLLTHNRKPAGRAEWEPIISEEDHAAVTALLSSSGRRTSFVQHDRRHLLTFGIGECGVCGARLRVAPKGGKPLYVCDTSRGCVGRREEWVDALVEEVVIGRLSQADAADLLIPRDGSKAALRDAVARADELRSRLQDAADLFAEGGITTEMMRTISSKIEPQLTEADALVSRLSRPRAFPAITEKGLTGANAGKTWAALDINQRRAVMETLGLRVRIMPTTRRGPGFDPSSIIIEWATPDEMAS